MPALITHYLFDAEVVHDLPQEFVVTDAEVNAFLLGDQGPDPFLARHLAWPNHLHLPSQLDYIVVYACRSSIVDALSYSRW